MDKYVTIKSIKKNTRVFGQKNVLKTLEELIDLNSTVCLYGGCGYGKTHIVEHVLDGKKYIKLSQDEITSRSKLDEFFSRVAESDYHIFIDDIDCEILGIKEISERKKISNGSLIITCKNIEKIDFYDCIKLDKLDEKELYDLAKYHYPKKNGYEIEKCIREYDGNLSNFIFSLGFSHSKDIFKQPKELIHDLVCHNSKNPDNPMDYIGKVIPEHGFSSAIIHENYPNGITDCETAAMIMDNISRSDMIDNELYKGNWEYSEYYNIHGIIWPSHLINHSLDVNKVRPGSVWTKYNNFKMRNNKLQNILTRTQGLCMEKLLLIGVICNKQHLDAIPLLVSYGIISSDIDVINHISFRKKIKSKTTQEIKKKLKTYMMN